MFCMYVNIFENFLPNKPLVAAFNVECLDRLPADVVSEIGQREHLVVSNS
jgi:hypothetical protein